MEQTTYTLGSTRRREVRRAWKIVALCFTVAVVLRVRTVLRPTITSVAAAEATGRIEDVMNEAIGRVGEVTPLVTVQTKADGSAATLEVDTAALRQTKARLTAAIYDALLPYRMSEVPIPLGNLSGVSFLTGRGPTLRVRLLLTERLQTSLHSTFYEAGINQTLHAITMRASVNVQILTPTMAKTFTVSQTYPLAETILVGGVPDAYTKINRLIDDISEDEIDYIYDFGAEVVE